MKHRSICRDLSDWEVIEMYVEHVKHGTSLEVLGARYGVSGRNVLRIFARLEKVAKEIGVI